MSINDFDTSKITKTKEVEVKNSPQKPISEPVGEELIYKKIAEVLGLETFSDMEKYKDQLNIIAEYLKEQGNEDVTDFEWNVKQLESRIGTPALGEKRIVNLARYVYLLGESDRVKNEIESLGGSNDNS